jgi:hypothetical protein
MAVTAKGYGQFLKLALSTKPVDLLNNTIKVMLCTSSYTPDQDNHTTKANVTGEVSGTGYTAGGKALTNKTLTYTASTNTTTFDADDVTWTNSTITARYAVIYADIGSTDSDKPLIGYVDFGEDKSSSNGDFTIQWSTSGICTFTTP